MFSIQPYPTILYSIRRPRMIAEQEEYGMGERRARNETTVVHYTQDSIEIRNAKAET